MRSELTDLERVHRTRAARAARRDVAMVALPASAVDAALAEVGSSEPIAAATERGPRRDVPGRSGESRMAIDDAHPAAGFGDAADDGLRRQLARQLDLLEIQQRQIRRLLEQSDRRAQVAQDAR